MTTSRMLACVCSSSYYECVFIFGAEGGDRTFSCFCAQVLVLVLVRIISVRSRRLPFVRQTAMVADRRNSCEQHGGEEVKEGRAVSHDDDE